MSESEERKEKQRKGSRSSSSSSSSSSSDSDDEHKKDEHKEEKSHKSEDPTPSKPADEPKPSSTDVHPKPDTGDHHPKPPDSDHAHHDSAASHPHIPVPDQPQPAAVGGHSQPSVQPVVQPVAKPVYQRQDFFLVSELNAKVAEVKDANAAAGAALIMWSRHTPNAKNQLWYVDEHGYIRSALNDFALDAAAGQRVHLQPFGGGASQQWVIDGQLVKNKSTGEVLDIAKQNKSDGAELLSYAVNNQANQHWRIEYV